MDPHKRTYEFGSTDERTYERFFAPGAYLVKSSGRPGVLAALQSVLHPLQTCANSNQPKDQYHSPSLEDSVGLRQRHHTGP